MKRNITGAMLAGAISGLSSSAGVPLEVGTVSDNVGYSEATDYNGSNFATLTRRHLSDHPDRVLAVVFATPW